MDHKKPVIDLIVLIPVFEDRESAAMLVKEIAAKVPIRPHLVIVEDGSVVAPMQTEDIAGSGLNGEIVYLVRNVGHQRAIAVGLAHVAVNYAVRAVVIMDADGEDRPEAIAGMLEDFEGGVDIVVAQRGRRRDSLGFRVGYLLYRLLFKILTGQAIQYGNFMVLTKQALQRLVRMQELWLHFPASVLVSRLRIRRMTVDRGVRYFGKSRMNFIALSLHGMRAIMVFAEDVLVRVALFCIGLAGGVMILLGSTTLLKLMGYTTPGWFSIVFGVLVVILMQAAILIFVMLMVTGVVQLSSTITKAQLEFLIDRIEHVPGQPSKLV